MDNPLLPLLPVKLPILPPTAWQTPSPSPTRVVPIQRQFVASIVDSIVGITLISSLFHCGWIPPCYVVYVDVDRSSSGKEGCNTLDFQLGQQGIFTTIPNRQWKIKVWQGQLNTSMTFFVTTLFCDRWHNSPATPQSWHLKAVRSTSLIQLALYRLTTLMEFSTWPTRSRRFVSDEPGATAGFAGQLRIRMTSSCLARPTLPLLVSLLAYSTLLSWLSIVFLSFQAWAWDSSRLARSNPWKQSCPNHYVSHP